MLALQAYYMKLHNIDTQKGSFALTMLSFAEEGGGDVGDTLGEAQHGQRERSLLCVDVV